MSESTRHRPIVNLAPNGPPSPPLHVKVLHPANNIAFLFLPACDFSSSLELNFGIHHETLLTACQIIACNEPGFLSTYRDRNNPGIADSTDSIIPAAQYYFHLNTEPSNPLYPLCIDFASWKFPHNAIPPSWDVQLNVPGNWDPSWTVMSQNIKARDTACLVTGWRDSLNTAYVVPRTHEVWMQKNRMDVYLQNPHHPCHQSSQNLFALRGDMHNEQFDRGHFVIVPKFGQLHIHFLRYGIEAIAQYHNVVFDHHDTLSHAFIYARFAWALMMIVRSLNPSQFRIQDDEDGGSGEPSDRGKKVEPRGRGNRRGNQGRRSPRKRTRPDDDNQDDDHSATYRPGASGSKRVETNFEGTSDLNSTSEELQEDIEKAIKTRHFFFVDPDEVATPVQYHTLGWYPGRGAVERKKSAYFAAHPQIRAHSNRMLPDDYDSEMGDS